jgi:predicted nucleic acid-binding protein
MSAEFFLDTNILIHAFTEQDGHKNSLIVAAALSGGCQALYSEDMQSGLKIHGLEIKNPF